MELLKNKEYYCRVGIFLLKIRVLKVVKKDCYWVSNCYGDRFLIVKQDDELIIKDYPIYDSTFMFIDHKEDLKVRILNEEEQWLECRKSQIRLNIQRIKDINLDIKVVKDTILKERLIQSKFNRVEENRFLRSELKGGYNETTR